jgi:hypothetical protein
VSWFTFRDLFLRCHLRPICAPALSFVGFARGQLSHAISAARLRRLMRSPRSRLSEKRRTRLAWLGGWRYQFHERLMSRIGILVSLD